MQTDHISIDIIQNDWIDIDVIWYKLTILAENYLQMVEWLPMNKNEILG